MRYAYKTRKNGAKMFFPLFYVYKHNYFSVDVRLWPGFVKTFESEKSHPDPVIPRSYSYISLIPFLITIAKIISGTYSISVSPYSSRNHIEINRSQSRRGKLIAPGPIVAEREIGEWKERQEEEEDRTGV